MARTLKVVFREDVRGVADAGELKMVSPGYARNYLFPRELAFKATDATLRQWETERQGALNRAARLRDESKTLVEKIESLTLTFTAKVGDEGRLFGSIGRAEIAEALGKEGVNVEKKAIVLVAPIKVAGPATVGVHAGVSQTAQLKINIVAEE